MKSIILQLIRIYQKYFSSGYGVLRLLFPGTFTSCRFSPSCSEYTYQAVFAYGIIKGLKLGVKRIFKCSPLSFGGYDPIPKHS